MFPLNIPKSLISFNQKGSSVNQKENVVSEVIIAEIREKVMKLFEIDDASKLKCFEAFVENKDHGLEHSLNVYKKAIEIVYIMNDKGYIVEFLKIFIMSFMHDSGRFHLHENNPKLREKCERKHSHCGISQIRLVKNKLNKKGIVFDESFWKDIFDYIKNHDFLNDRLDPNYQEPESLEGQIVRLADRISTDIETEIERYWETGKRLKTPYFKDDISFNDRVEFNFTKIGEYIKSKKFDEFTFFLSLLSINENDFSNPHLREIYADWHASKDGAIKKILEIGKQEGYKDEEIKKMNQLISDYMNYFNIKF